jgi:hypothetical protein
MGELTINNIDSLVLLRKIERFSYFNDSKKIGEAKTGQQITFPDRSTQQFISFEADGQSIEIHFINYDDSTIHYPLQQGYFGKNQLIGFASLMGITLQSHPLNEETLRASHNNNPVWIGLVSTSSKKHFLITYLKTGRTEFEDNIIQVLSIWRVSLKT